ncbi:MAG: EF-hand domain-containing protein [Candidatus Poseidoniaceae archaeon]
MSDEENQDIPMAQCGACNAIVPLDSESCPECGAGFSGISDEALGVCGQCGSIIPVDSESCGDCGAFFVDLGPSKGDTVSPDMDEVLEIEQPVSAEEVEFSGTTSNEELAHEETVEARSDLVEEVTQVEETVHEEQTVTITESEIVSGSEEVASYIADDDFGEETQSEEIVSDEDDEDSTEDIDSYIDEVDLDEEEEMVEKSPALAEAEILSESEEEVEDTVPDVESNESTSDDIEGDSNEEMDAYIDEVNDEETTSESEEIEEEMDDSESNLLEELSEDEDSEEVEEETHDTEEESESDEDIESSDTEEEDDEEPQEEEEPIDQHLIVMAFENLALAIAGAGMTAGEAFEEMDSSSDGMIDAPELQKGIQKIAGEKISPKEVTLILKYLDNDGNKRIDPNELLKALDDLRIGIQPGKDPRNKTLSSPVQKFLMGKKANDIFYPIAYFLTVTFIGLWVVNGMGLLVDGSGGTVVYEGGVDQWGGEIREANWNLCESDALEEMIDPCQGTVAVGETYPCDPAIDANKCENSLTPFSGENDASSMPAGFYTDGIVMIILGVIGLAVTAYLHLIYAKALRRKAKKASGKLDEEEDSEEDEEAEEDTESDDEEEVEDEDDEEVEDDDEEEVEDDDEEEVEDDDEEDDIDVGDWIGLDIDGDEFFGEIIEFDDDEGTVTIETEDGEEITGDQEDMFLDEDDDE